MEFKESKLIELNLVTGDGNYSSKYPKSEEFIENGIPFLSASDFSGKLIDFKNSKKISSDLHHNLLKGHVKKDDILIVVRGNGVGKIGYITENIDECNLNAQLAFIRCNNTTFDSHYLYYYLLNNTDYLKTFVSGSAQPQLTMTSLMNVKIKYPSYNNQIKISSILSEIDKKILNNIKTNNNLHEYSKQLFKKWFIDFDENITKKKTKLGEIPENWSIKNITEFTNIKYGKGLSKDNLLDYGYDVYGGNGIIGKIDNYMYEKSQILISCRGAASGNVIISLPKSYVTSNSLILETKDIYFNYLKEYSLYYNYYEYATGSAQPQITIDSLKVINMVVPTEELLEKFNNILNPINQKITNNILENRNLEELRDILLPKLMNGEIDLDKIEI